MNKFGFNYSLFDKQGRRKYLNLPERSRFCNALECLDQESKLFSLLLYWTGVRISEARSLLVDQVDFDEGNIVIRTMKKRRQDIYRQIPIPPEFCSQLKSFIQCKSLTTSIWSRSVRTYSRHIKIAMSNAEIHGPQASAKGLRHSFALVCATGNVPLNLICRWMGHSSMEITAIYLDIVGTEEREFAKRIWEDP